MEGLAAVKPSSSTSVALHARKLPAVPVFSQEGPCVFPGAHMQLPLPSAAHKQWAVLQHM